jgi:hypothetical protein
MRVIQLKKFGDAQRRFGDKPPKRIEDYVFEK